MFKVSAFSSNTGVQTLAPLVDGAVDNTLIEARPLLHETFL
jgi:hypothetical protein